MDAFVPASKSFKREGRQRRFTMDPTTFSTNRRTSGFFRKKFATGATGLLNLPNSSERPNIRLRKGMPFR
jgi:hypothetical protein